MNNNLSSYRAQGYAETCFIVSKLDNFLRSDCQYIKIMPSIPKNKDNAVGRINMIHQTDWLNCDCELDDFMELYLRGLLIFKGGNFSGNMTLMSTKMVSLVKCIVFFLFAVAERLSECN